MIFVRDERFIRGTTQKLQPGMYGPYSILKKLEDDAYVIDLPDTLKISKVFHVRDFFEYHGGKPFYPSLNSRTSSFEEEGTDVGQLSSEIQNQKNHEKPKKRLFRNWELGQEPLKYQHYKLQDGSGQTRKTGKAKGAQA